MGLDNGVIIKGKTIRAKDFLKTHFPALNEGGNPTEYEFAYWRKCWNIRSKFLEIYKDKYDEYEQEIHFTIEDLYDVVEHILKYFLEEDNWRGGNWRSIWDWHIYLPHLADAIFNIRCFIEEVQEEGLNNDDFEIYFYDSY